eukprot:CAMPEP_0115558260 /NCGR_PEP_ID=MMETSP0271-20121206/99344_1 /TAXON_ID=71861 /ORGANISM="Scrippsiella trochoidea, Strain CCMP3099" /LENGTH=447 /DNA_ID=CAMNT_0002992265 /DNA_START=54 /DNA_END=1397 /DNA_ORIENTATION=-
MPYAPKSARARQIRSLAWVRSGGAGGTGDTAQVACPEQCKIQSASHEGNIFRHQRTWVPPTCRVPPAPRKREPIPGEQELLYLALYRDKVAEVARQQEELANAGASSGAKGARAARRRRGSSAVEGPNSGALHRLDGGGEPQSSLADLGGSGPPPEGEAAAERRPDGLAEPSLRDDAKPAGGPEAMLGDGLAAGAPPDRLAAAGGATAAGTAAVALTSSSPSDQGRQLRGAPTAAHVASVPVHAAFGGVVSEHLEAKQLGKLFDQWRAKQEEETNTTFSTTRARSARGGRSGGAGIPMSVSSRTASALDRATGATHRTVTEDSVALLPGLGPAAPLPDDDERSFATTEFGGGGRGERLGVAEDERPGAARSETTPSGGRSLAGDRVGMTAERSKSDRMYSLLTNPKTRIENFAERGFYDRDTALPSHIEGFPVLNLTKLYEGPWRLS